LTPLKADNPGMFIVQDGFELNLNIGIKNKKHSETFFELVKLSFKKCEELKDKPFAELLIQLFTDIKIPKTENENRSKNKKQFQMTIHATAGDLKVRQCSLTDFIFTFVAFASFIFISYLLHLP
jgi:hypothetical protein